MAEQKPSYDQLSPGGEVLEAAGKALYGDNWKNRLAEDLGIRNRSLQRWLPGHAPVPDGIWEALLERLEARGAALSAAREAVVRQLAGAPGT